MINRIDRGFRKKCTLFNLINQVKCPEPCNKSLCFSFDIVNDNDNVNGLCPPTFTDVNDNDKDIDKDKDEVNEKVNNNYKVYNNDKVDNNNIDKVNNNDKANIDDKFNINDKDVDKPETNNINKTNSNNNDSDDSDESIWVNCFHLLPQK